jgi:hypothetical protein
MTKKENQRGGFIQSQRLYHCEVCGGIAKGNRFVSTHLTNACSGVQKRVTKESTKLNQHRLEEAKMNTKQWKADKLVAETNLLFKQFRTDAMRDIKNMREINKEVVQDLLMTYHTQIF